MSCEKRTINMYILFLNGWAPACMYTLTCVHIMWLCGHYVFFPLLMKYPGVLFMMLIGNGFCNNCFQKDNNSVLMLIVVFIFGAHNSNKEKCRVIFLYIVTLLLLQTSLHKLSPHSLLIYLALSLLMAAILWDTAFNL